jgi:hypothetical protein
MTIYQTVRVVHILGALGMFMTVGVELVALRALATARSVAQARSAMDVFRVNRIIGPIVLLMVVVPGFYMASQGWGQQAWLRVAMLVLLLLIIIGATVTRRGMAAVGSALQGPDRPLDEPAGGERTLSWLWSSYLTRTFLLLAIVLLMTTKPAMSSALELVATALASAAAMSVLFWRGGSARRSEWRRPPAEAS